MRNPVAGLNRKNIKELTDRKKRWDFDQAAKAAREKYGDAPKSKPKKKQPKYSQEYLSAKNAYETAKEVGGTSKEELRRLWRVMKNAEKKQK